MKFKHKDLLTLEELDEEEINLILNTAESFKEISERTIKKVPLLRGRTIANLFFEPSTRTRISFELAEKRLSADSTNFSSSSSSILKGETLLDTARNIEAMKIDIAVMRHKAAGASSFIAKRLEVSIINAGDGAHEHPTQGLLDIFTIKEKKKKLNGLNVSIVGDILHSRVAKSNIWGLKKLGANVGVFAPRTLLPVGIEEMGVRIYTRIEEAIKQADVLNILRIQLERQNQCYLPSLREYYTLFGLTWEKLEEHAKKDVLIMHPGPVNRGVEIESRIADSHYSVILEQVTNGVAIRMAVLYLIIGGEKDGAEIEGK